MKYLLRGTLPLAALFFAEVGGASVGRSKTPQIDPRIPSADSPASQPRTQIASSILDRPELVPPSGTPTVPPAGAGEVMTLDMALAQAGAASPAAEVGMLGVQAAEAGRAVAALRPNPTLTAETENVAGSGPYRGFDQSETTVGFALPLELGGKRDARIALAVAQTQRARIDAAIALADLRLRVTQAYAAALAADRRLVVAGAQIGITRENLRVASDRVMVGANSPLDRERAALLNVNAQTELEQARLSAAAARVALSLFTGGAVDGPLDDGWFTRIVAPAAGPPVAITVDGTLALAAASADVSAAEAQLRLARAQRIPDLTVSAGTRRFEATNDQALVVGVSIPLPIFNNGRAAVTQARFQRDQTDARRRLARFEAEQAIATTRADRDRAAVAVRASEPALAAATEAARIARIGYGEGKFDQLALLEAEQALLTARNAAIDALAQYQDAAARLARLTAPAPTPVVTGN